MGSTAQWQACCARTGAVAHLFEDANEAQEWPDLHIAIDAAHKAY